MHGHNSKLTPAEGKALLFHHFNAIRAQQARVDAARADLKVLRGKAKADGIVLADIDFMARCATLEDPEIVPNELKRMMEIAEWMALPVQYQPDLFVDRAPAEERAEAAGVLAGMTGKTLEHDFNPGSPQAQAYEKGWKRGQKELAKGIKAMEKITPAENDGEDGGGDG